MKLKKITAIILVLILTITCLCSCGKTEDPEENKYGEGYTLVVGFDAEFPPYGYKDENGNYVGFDLDMAAELCKRLGWEIELRPIDWDAKDFELESGSISCIWNGFTMNGREDLYAWSDAYMDNSQVFVTKKSANINTFADLAGKIVTVQKDSSCEAALNDEDNPDAIALRDSFKTLATCADYNTAFLELEAGATEAVGMDIGVAKYQIAGREDEFVIMTQTLTEEQYGVGFYLENTELRDIVNAELKAMAADGTFAEISNEWFGYDVCTLE